MFAVDNRFDVSWSFISIHVRMIVWKNCMVFKNMNLMQVTVEPFLPWCQFK
jgi:hypothetical protein